MSGRRLLAVIWRESLQVARDPFLLTAAFATPCLLMLVLGYGLTIDIEGLAFGYLDRDASPSSRRYIETFRHSPYFDSGTRLLAPDAIDRALEAGDLAFVIEIAEDFGRLLERRERLPVSFWIDGTLPFKAEIARGYIEGMHRAFLLEAGSAGVPARAPLRTVRTRYWYNEALRSRLAFVPGLIAALLAMIPPVLTAVAVTREKELGSIANLYSTPLRSSEFLLGKRIPYVAVSLLAFGLLFLLATLLFRVPFRGSLGALLAGALLYTSATTGFGLVISSFTRTQIASLMVVMILTLLPAFLYSGFFTPVSSLSGAAKAIAVSFPAAYFVKIAVGTFTKGLALADLWPDFMALAGFTVLLDAIAFVLTRDQER